MPPGPAHEPSLTQLSQALGQPADGVLFIVEIAGPDAPPAQALPVTEPVTAGLLLGLAALLLRRPKRARRPPR